MKKLFTLIALFVFSTTSFLVAQTNVYLKINHKLGSAPFAINAPVTNNLGNDFDVSRCEYYISQITLIHDGGTETTVPSFWILANAETQVNELLGSFSITSLEGIRFGIGVEQAVNHDDPSTYPMSHPLAPKSPSMHWGWTSGYRFVAIEGMGSPALNQRIQIHALGDGNYMTATVNTAGTVSGSDLIVDLDADYIQAYYNIDVSAGLINHGETDEAVTLLENFSTLVFSEADNSVGMAENLAAGMEMTLAPNPTQSHFRVQVTGNTQPAQITISDVSGRMVKQQELNSTGILEMEMPVAGLYLVSLSQAGLPLITQKLVVTQ